MKRIITLFVVIVMVLSIAVVTASAEEIPTAKIVASLVGDSVPVVGEKFVIAISATEISSGLFVSGQVGIEYPVNVVTPVIYAIEEPRPVIAPAQMIGDVSNRFSSIDYTGKFSVINSINRETGKGLIGIYIDLGAIDQTATIVNNGTHNMFSLAFMLNEGYTYDDFYLTLVTEEAEFFLAADKKTVSSGSNGNITVESIEKAKTAVNTNIAVQSGYVTEELAKETGSNINLEVLSKEIVNTFAAESVESDLNAEINILYNSEYHEAVLKANNVLNASLTITNSGTADTNCVCYIAEYNADGCMTGMARNSEISVPAGETVVTNVSKTFSSSNTAKAKIFLWEKGTLVPVGDDIILTAKSADYYADTFSTAQNYDITKTINGKINTISDVDYIKFIPVSSGKYVIHVSSNANISGGLYDEQKKLIVSGKSFNSGYYCDTDLVSGNTYYLKTTGNIVGEYTIMVNKMSEDGFVEITNDSIKFVQSCDSTSQVNVNLYSFGTLLQSSATTPSDNRIAAEFNIENLQPEYTIAVIKDNTIISLYEIKIIETSKSYNVTPKSYVSVPTAVSNATNMSDIYFSVVFSESEFIIFDACEYTYNVFETGTGLISGASVNIKNVEKNAVIFISTKTLTNSWSGNVNTVKLQAISNGNFTVRTIVYSVR